MYAQKSISEPALKVFQTTNDTILIDSLSLISGSIKLFTESGKKIDSSNYTINSLTSELIWNKDSPFRKEKVKIKYKTYPFSFYQEYYHKNPNRIQDEVSITRNPFRYTAVPRNNDDIFELGGIEKSGSISRGLGFGNNRDLSVSSSMNLQLNGKIADNLYVMAAISDENVPIQPEGNTQQLQDFDKVFIQIYNDRARLIAGDYMIKSNNSYFMKYLKKAQGISGASRFYLGKNEKDNAKAAKMDVQLSGALSRGKFSRNVIQGVEGNQGPYRLRGEGNETYIIILSGTERVFVDGKLLIRGQDSDYIINYNTAEITFTAKQIVTKDKRIIIEFQYSDQNYTRSVVQFSDFYEYKKLKLNFNLYSEQDAKNQSLQQDLNDEQKAILADVGDSLNQAISSGARLTEFNENEVLYKIIDTLGYDSVLVYSTNPDSAFYRVSFSEVGFGNGDYVLLNSVANGRVYKWIDPLTSGVKQGDYAPVVLLFSPKQKQMIALGGSYNFNKNSSLKFEIAISNNDINTFSDKDKNDDIGYSGKVTWNNKIKLKEKTKWALIPELGYEHWSKYFTEIERVRTVEFYRDWNLRDVKLSEDQNLTSASLALNNGNKGQLKYSWNGFFSGSEYNANKHVMGMDVKDKGLFVDFDGYFLDSRGSLSSTKFIRHKSLIQQRILFFNVGYRDDREDNRIQDLKGDTLSATTYRFWEKEFFVKSIDSAALQYKVFYNQRDDEKPEDDKVKRVTFGESVGLALDWKKNRTIQIASKTTYRKLKIENERLTTQKADENFLNRIEYNLRLLKGAITASSFYEIGSGLEAGREFQFIQVPSGQGEYTWFDYNNNGIKEINEFEIAIFEDQKNYIKISIVTDDYVKVFTNQFNQTIMINPARVWRKEKGIQKFLSAFSDQFAYRINRKTKSEENNVRFNPMPNVGLDTFLVTLNSSLRNTVYFNRTHPVFGIDWTYQDIKGRVFITNGLESRSNVFHNVRARVNFGRLLLTEIDAKYGNKSSSADYANSRDFLIEYFSVQPKITFQKGVGFRLSVLYKYQQKENSPNLENALGLESELGESHKLGFETKINKVGKGSFVAEINIINMSYNGAPNSSLSYEMLESLLPGVNATWQISYQRNIGKYLQLDLSYGGRQSEDSKTIHTGSMRVRAYF